MANCHFPNWNDSKRPILNVTSKDDSAALLERVNEACREKSPLRIVGGNSKKFLGNAVEETQTELSIAGHTGIITYEPTELVVTVRAGTPLKELNEALNAAGQMLPFEPPEFGGSTIGGVLACGLSGPRRPFFGSARDYVLGMRVINGQAQDLSFGGEVMKNVAGYDVSRVQVGAWGTLGVLLDMSMKVLPKPAKELTLRQSSQAHASHEFASLLRQPLPLSAAMLVDDSRYLRLSGSDTAVDAAAAKLGGDIVANDDQLWASIKDHTHEFFTQGVQSHGGESSLWRISVADYVPAIDLDGEWLYDWAGAQRWLKTSESAERIFDAVAQHGGHATRYTANEDPSQPAFQPVKDPMRRLQSRVRDSFDPHRLFNRGRFHPEFDHVDAPDGAVSV